MRRIVTQYARCPRYQLAAAAAGINRQTLAAWRARGRVDREVLEDEILDQVMGYRSETNPGGPMPWHEVERATGVEVSLFARLVIELDEAELSFINEKLSRIAEAGRGRQRTVARANGTVVVEEVSPSWQADAWQLERMIPGFAKPRAGVEIRSDEDDVEAGYATFARDLDAIAGFGPGDGSSNKGGGETH